MGGAVSGFYHRPQDTPASGGPPAQARGQPRCPPPVEAARRPRRQGPTLVTPLPAPSTHGQKPSWKNVSAACCDLPGGVGQPPACSPACPCPCPPCSELGENPEVFILWVPLQAGVRSAGVAGGLPTGWAPPTPCAASAHGSPRRSGRGPRREGAVGGRGALRPRVSAPGRRLRASSGSFELRILSLSPQVATRDLRPFHRCVARRCPTGAGAASPPMSRLLGDRLSVGEDFLQDRLPAAQG